MAVAGVETKAGTYTLAQRLRYEGRLSLDDETLEYLVLYRWPGNVRQLVNEVSRLVAYAEPDSTISPGLAAPVIGRQPTSLARSSVPVGSATIAASVSPFAAGVLPPTC